MHDTEGSLNAANSYATASVVWYDGLGRTVATANFGREDALRARNALLLPRTSGTDIGGSYRRRSDRR